MQLIPEFTNPIGVCTVCRSSRRQGDLVADFGSQVELLAPGADIGVEFRILDGDFQVCETCGKELGRLFGMIDQKQADLLSKSNDHYKKAWAEAVERAEAAEDLLADLRRYDEAKALAEKVFGPEQGK